MCRIAMFLVGVAGACGDDAAISQIDAAPCVDDTHDEDGDGIGDACDICPAAPDPLQRDTTEAATMINFPDGVGDACDPRPSLSGDKLAAFHPFVDPATAAAWNGTGWTIEDDRARATGDARWVHRSRADGDGVFVQARVAALAFQPGGSFEVVVDGDGVGSGLACAIDDTDRLIAREVDGAMMTTTTAMPIAGAITLAAWRVIDVQRSGELRCRVTFDGGMASVEIPTLDGFAIGLYGFAQTSATTDVTSIVVYTSPTLPDTGS